MNLDFHLILASKSPRRSEILRNAGIPFKVRAKKVDESYDKNMDPFQVAEWLSLAKADSAEIAENEVVLTADTIVICEETILGKPDSGKDAILMLSKLSGRSHFVVTGCTLKSNQKTVTFRSVTEVTFGPLSEDDIQFYVEKYKPHDKAGAYGIQEWIGMVGVTSIKGSYYNVVGLPIDLVYAHLKKFRI